MIKFCRLCTSEFWSRWRNTPDICAECLLQASARICPVCLAVHAVARDPMQLALPGIDAAGVVDEFAYVAPPENATQAERRKYPYH